jgi:hypothetical protein
MIAIENYPSWNTNHQKELVVKKEESDTSGPAPLPTKRSKPLTDELLSNAAKKKKVASVTPTAADASTILIATNLSAAQMEDGRADVVKDSVDQGAGASGSSLTVCVINVQLLLPANHSVPITQ